MNPRSVDAFASATKSNRQGERAGRTLFKALLVSALLSGALAAGPADAGLTITTSGTITSGTATGGLFGGMTNLAGDSYTLIVHYNNLGPNYFALPDGSFAQDVESSPGLTGFVTAIVNGIPLTTPLTNSLGTTLAEDNFDFFGSNEGYNGSSSTGAYVNVLQLLSCSATCVPYADLNAPVTYVPGPFDFSSDQYTFRGAGFPAAGTPTATFIGTEARFALVPEPPSWVLLATGLLGLGMLVRRRYA
jgi:hypothetical protein